jgi:hypothetical protein
MFRVLSLGLVAFLGLLAGCDSSPATTIDAKTAPVSGPHGGMAYPIPGEGGYAEVVVERTKGTAKLPGKASLSVYFLKTDLKAALGTAPTEVSASIVTPEKPEPTPVTLTLKPVAKDALATARFASEPGPFDFDELRGEVKATVDGKPFAASFAFR